MARPTPKNMPIPIYYALPCRSWLFCVKGCMHNYGKSPKLGSTRVLPSIGIGAWMTTDNTPLPICTAMPNLVVLLTQLKSERENSNYWGHWGPVPVECGVVYPLKTCYSPRYHLGRGLHDPLHLNPLSMWVIMPNLIASGQIVPAWVWRSEWKTGFLKSCL